MVGVDVGAVVLSKSRVEPPMIADQPYCSSSPNGQVVSTRRFEAANGLSATISASLTANGVAASVTASCITGSVTAVLTASDVAASLTACCLTASVTAVLAASGVAASLMPGV